jgi:hypothetical protein
MNCVILLPSLLSTQVSTDLRTRKKPSELTAVKTAASRSPSRVGSGDGEAAVMHALPVPGWGWAG